MNKISIKKYYFYIAILALILINLIIFNNGLKNDFVWDDYLLIKENHVIKDLSISHIQDMFKIDRNMFMYKPITLLSFAADYKIGNGEPFNFHLTNICLHTLNSILIFILTDKISENKIIASVAAIIFSIHPVRSESVIWISERKDVLSGFFFLISFIYYVKFKKDNFKIAYFISLVTFVLALFSKISTVTIPLIIIFYDFLFEENFSIKKQFHYYIPFLLISAVMTYIQAFMTYHLEMNPKYDNLNIIQLIITILLIYGKYFIMFIFPVNLKIIYVNAQDIKSYNLIELILYTLIPLVILTTAFIIRKKQKIISFGIFWFFSMILPCLYLYKWTLCISNRYLYLPSIGLSIFIGALFYLATTLTARKFSVWFILIAMLLFYSSITIYGNTIWKNDLTLWESVYKQNPNNTYIIKNLAIAYMKKGYTEEAVEKFNIILSVENTNYEVYLLLAGCLEKQKKYDSAIEVYRKAIEINPKKIDAYMNSGALYYAIKDYNNSYIMYKEALNRNPDLKEIKDFLPYLKKLNKANNTKK